MRTMISRARLGANSGNRSLMLLSELEPEVLAQHVDGLRGEASLSPHEPADLRVVDARVLLDLGERSSAVADVPSQLSCQGIREASACPFHRRASPPAIAVDWNCRGG